MSIKQYELHHSPLTHLDLKMIAVNLQHKENKLKHCLKPVMMSYCTYFSTLG